MIASRKTGRDRVAAYITAYEDLSAVLRCVAAIRAQSVPVEQIFILDNSRSPLRLWPEEGLVVERYPENVGISGGLRRGLQWALARDFDFLWTFDQDSEPAPDCLGKLLQARDRRSDTIAILGPTAIDPRSNRIIEGAIFDRDRFVPRTPPDAREPYPCDAPITSGSLIALAAARRVPLPRADLFIDGVDMDYGMILKKAGFENLIVPDALLCHRFSLPISRRFLHRRVTLLQYSPLRHYYICRNHTFLALRYARGWQYLATGCVRRIQYMLHAMVAIALFDSETKLPKLRACLVGTFHGIRGKLGKVWLG